MQRKQKQPKVITNVLVVTANLLEQLHTYIADGKTGCSFLFKKIAELNQRLR